MDDKEEVKQLLVALIASGPTPYHVQKLLYDFKKEFGYNLPMFGFNSSIDFLKSIPDVIKLTGSEMMIEVQLVDNPKSAHISSLVQRQNSKKSKKKPHLEDKVASPIYNTVFNNAEGCHQNKNSEITQNLKNVDSLYPHCNNGNLNQNLNTQLNFEENKISSPTEIANDKHMKSTYNYKQLNKLKVNIVAATGFCRKVDQTGNINMNVVTDIDDIPKLDLKSHITVGEYIEVCVTNVRTPHSFTIQLRKFKMRMKNFLHELQIFYNQNANNYGVPSHLIKPDLVCVVLYENNYKCAEWHRSIVLDVINFSVVWVKLLDTGKVLEVESKNLRLLHHYFAEFPVQALNGYLAYLQPYENYNWPSHANKRFKELVLDKDLIAGVICLDYKHSWLSVALTDTSGVEIHISDTLVEENLATFEVDVNALASFVRMQNSVEAHNHEKQCPCIQSSSASKNLLKSRELDSKGVFRCTRSNTKLRKLFDNPSTSVVSN